VADSDEDGGLAAGFIMGSSQLTSPGASISRTGVGVCPHQVTSSRRIEQLCLTDVAFRVIADGRPVPGRVRRRPSPRPVELGMGKVGVVALNGAAATVISG
jgi:hypothetical protein